MKTSVATWSERKCRRIHSSNDIIMNNIIKTGINYFIYNVSTSNTLISNNSTDNNEYNSNSNNINIKINIFCSTWLWTSQLTLYL